MILAVDCGNSRLKWGVHDQGRWIKTGTVPLPRLARLKKAWRKMPSAEKIVVANVAGRSVGKRLGAILSRRGAPPIWVAARSRQCGVSNGYAKPGQLGADRWAALIGAWAKFRGPCLVIAAGTATTVDMLRGDGTFAG